MILGRNIEVWTVRAKGWLGKKNGELLRLMAMPILKYLLLLTGICPISKILQNFR